MYVKTDRFDQFLLGYVARVQLNPTTSSLLQSRQDQHGAIAANTAAVCVTL